MQAAVDGFGSGAIASATATASGPVGTIVYVLLGITLFLVVAGIVVYAIKHFGGSAR